MGIPDHLTCLLRNLYAGQEATVRTRHGKMDWVQIGKGVCKGCVLSPCLFNLYAEYITWNARLDEAQTGIKISRRISVTSDMQVTLPLWQKVKNWRASWWKESEKSWWEESEKTGLKLNIQKTKIVASGPITSWQINGEIMGISGECVISLVLSCHSKDLTWQNSVIAQLQFSFIWQIKDSTPLSCEGRLTPKRGLNPSWLSPFIHLSPPDLEPAQCKLS